MPTITLDPPIPIFRIFDIPKAMAFYRDWLGMTVDWEHRFAEGMPLYCQVSRGPLVLHLSEHSGDASPAARVFIPLHGVEALHAELHSRPYGFNRPGIVRQPWGRELELTDPFSNRLTFCERDAHGE